MEEPQILSAFQELAPAPVAQADSALVFDACHVGVVLRAVLFVELAMAVGVSFGSTSFLEWLMRLGLVSGGALPATLLWLICGCGLKRLLARLPSPAQHVVGGLMGLLAGLYACAMLSVFAAVDSPPWWASAASGAFLAAVLVTALVLRARGKTPANTAARLGELQARIRPHFLFNTLNTAIALVRAEPAIAENLLEDLSDLFRHALAEQGESVSLAEELALAQRYLSIEAIRFGPRLRLEWDIDVTASTARLPPLLLQPLVENAVKHGVEPSHEGARLKVSTQRRGDRVVIKVINTVPGGQGHHGNGIALKNVSQRLQLLHDVQAQFQTVFKDGLFQVRIEVPL